MNKFFFLKKFGVPQNPIFKIISYFMKLPIKNAQLQLLKIHKDKNIINLILTIQKDRGLSMWPTDMVQIYHCASSAKKITGDFAEVGVYQGKSAKLICEAKGDKLLHLFDTFSGLPKLESVDGDLLHEGQFAVNLNSVKTYLGSYKNVTFYPGLFPKTAEPIKNKSFAFVHLDADLYRSTLECLKFFYPRMTKRGIILSHDYSISVPGVKKAFDDFFADKTESVIGLSTSQCLVIKL